MTPRNFARLAAGVVAGGFLLFPVYGQKTGTGLRVPRPAQAPGTSTELHVGTRTRH